MFTGVERSPRLLINITTMSPIDDLFNGIYVSWICFMSVVHFTLTDTKMIRRYLAKNGRLLSQQIKTIFLIQYYSI